MRPEISMYRLANTNAAVKTRILDKRRERVANAGRDYDAIWLGDSITHFWEHPGKVEVFREKFGRYRIFNAGFGGDRVENVLWNLRYGGVLDGVRTRLVTLMIGTNNIWYDSAEDIAAGIALCVKEIRARQPQAKILLHSLLPREVAHKRGGRDFRRKRPNVDEVMPKLKRVNELIRPLADDEAVIFVDLFPAFLDAEGLPNIDLLPDGTHPGPEGLAVWADSVLPMYRRILGDVL